MSCVNPKVFATPCWLKSSLLLGLLAVAACSGASSGPAGEINGASPDPTMSLDAGRGVSPEGRGPQGPGDGCSLRQGCLGPAAPESPAAPPPLGDAIFRGTALDPAELSPNDELLRTADRNGDGQLSTVELVLALKPETGEVFQGFVTLVLDQYGAFPHIFFVHESYLTATERGFLVEGDLSLTTPLGFVTFAKAHLFFEHGERKEDGLMRFGGEVELPFPALGALEGLTLSSPLRVVAGFDRGEQLKSLNAPLNDERRYLYFHYSTGFTAAGGPISFTSPASTQATFVLDASDPFVYFAGDLPGVKMLRIKNVGIGASAQGLIPFAPVTTWGLPADVTTPFKGHLYLHGSVPLTKLPLTLTGQTVLDIDPYASGRRLVDIDQPGLELGFNGDLALTADFLTFFSFEAELGRASAAVLASADEQRAYVSGQVAPDRSFLPEKLPISAQESVQVAGLISDKLENSFLHSRGYYGIDGRKLGELAGVPLGDLMLADGELLIDRTGFRLRGQLAAGAELHKDLSFAAGAKLEAHFADAPRDFFVEITGAARVVGHSLLDVRARVDASGVALQGALDTGLTSIALTGSITNAGVALEGEAAVHIDVRGAHEVAEWVVDGAICGYELVRDGAICGYELVKDGALCGYEVVQSGALCGYEKITDGAKCGYEQITNAAKCGVQSLDCWKSRRICAGALGCYNQPYWCPGCCSQPKTCSDLSRPKTCSDLSRPKTCSDLSQPKTCSNFNLPKTCEDLNQPKRCQRNNLVRDFSFGSFEGKAELGLSSQAGLGGSVSGLYCAHEGACTTLAGGRVKVGSKLEACVTIPPSLGEFCERL